MKKGFLSPVIVIVVGVLVIAAIAWTAFYLGKKSSTPTTSNSVVTVQASPVPAPTADATANWKIYTSTQGEYSIKYPSDLSVSENTKEYANQVIPTVAIGTGPFAGALSESIFIDVRDLPTISTINDYLTQTVWAGTHPGNFQSTPFTLDSQSGIRTNDIPGQFEYDTVIVKKGTKFYDIRLLKAASSINWKIIGEDRYNQILSTFKFTQ